MYTYKIKIMKISGRLNESAGELPKVLSYKSKQKLNERAVFNKALKYIRSKYGVVLEMAAVKDIAEDCWYEEEYRRRQERWADKHYGEPEPDMLDDEWEW